MLFHKFHIINLYGQQNQNTWAVPYTNLITLHNRVPSLEKSICLSHINAHSIQDRIEEFQHVIQEKTDVCIITDSWLKSSDINGNLYHEVPPLGYNIISHPRLDRRQGGGIMIVLKKNIKVKYHTIRRKVFKTTEYANLSLHLNVKTINLYVFYRWLAKGIIAFCNELAGLLQENITNDKGDIILTGDFNIHIDDMGSSDTLTFLKTLDSLDLRKHVNFPAHRSQHYLDMFIDSRQSPTIIEVR